MKNKVCLCGFLVLNATVFAQNVRTSENLSGQAHFSPDGRSMLSTSGQFFDLRTGRTAGDLNYKGTDQNGAPTYFEAGFSPSGKFILYNRKVYDAQSLIPLFDLPERQNYTRHFRPEEKHFYRLKDLDAVGFAHDDGRVIAADEIIDLKTKQTISTLKPNPIKYGLAYLEAVSFTHASIRQSVSLTADFTNYSSNYNDAVSPNVNYFISGESLKDDRIGFFQIQNFNAKEEYDAVQDINSLFYRIDAKLISKAKLTQDFDEMNVTFALQNNRAAIVDGTELRIFDLASGSQKGKITTPMKEKTWEFARFSPSGNLLFGKYSNSYGIFSPGGKMVSALEPDPELEWQLISSPVFSPDDRFLVSGNDGSVYDVKTGKRISKAPLYAFGIVTLSATLSPDDQAIFHYSDGTSRIFDAKSGVEYFTEIISNSNTLHFSVSQTGKWMGASNWNGNVSLWNQPSASPLSTWKPHGDFPVTQLVFDEPNQRVFSIGLDNTIKIWSLPDVRLEKTIEMELPVNQLYLVKGQLLAATISNLYEIDIATGKQQVIANHENAYPIQVNESANAVLLSKKLIHIPLRQEIVDFEIVRKRETRWDKVTGAGTNPSEKEAVYTITSSDSKVSRWNLARGMVSTVDFTNMAENEVSSSGFDRPHSQVGNAALFGEGNAQLFHFDKRKYSSPLFAAGKKQGFSSSSANDYVHLSADGKRLARSEMADGRRVLFVYETETGALISTIQGDQNDNIFRGFFSASGDTIFFGYQSGTETPYFLASAEVKTGKWLKRIENFPFEPRQISVAPNSSWIAVHDGWKKVHVYSTSLTKKMSEVELPFVSVHPFMIPSPNSTSLLLTNRDQFKGGESLLINPATGTFRHLPGLHYYVCFSADGKQIISLRKDAKAAADLMLIYRTETLELVSTAMQVGISSKSIFFTPDLFYMASRDAVKELHFASGKNTFLFDQFDLRFNRPDKVLQRLGYAEQPLLTAYKKAWEKRVRMSGFDPRLFDGFDVSLNAPVVFATQSIPQISEAPAVTVAFRADGNGIPLKSVQITQNGVPVFGRMGKPVSSTREPKISGDFSFELPLVSGKNVIEYSVLNEQGIESVRGRETVFYKPKSPVKPNLHVIAIGVSKFKESEFNLTYADKDANDLSALLKNTAGMYGNITVHTLINENATRANVLKLRAELERTSVDDEVIVFAASHGVLDEELDYYLAMHDMDFANPKKGGLRYDELENLIDAIPARNKLVLIDACHSGEVDKEESQLIAANDAQTGGVKSRGFLKKVTKKEGIGLANSFELMKELFADLRRNNGAVVISSASGKEYAFESSEWANGVFTYSVLEGLKSGKADLNKDKTVSVSELRDYVSKRVQELTAGMQNPTSRSENLENDFRVW